MIPALFLVAAILRIWGIWSMPLWYDENFTLLAARLPLDRMMLALQGDVHPPLWYLTVWPLIQLGAPGWTMRVLSVSFSLIGLWLFGRILLKLNVDLMPRTIALGIMAVSPWQLYYAQEARMYAELQFLVLLGFDAILDRNWLRFGLASALMAYCQNYGPFYSVAIGAYALIRNWRDIWKLSIAACGVTLAYLPWLIGGLTPQLEYLRSVGYWIGQVSSGSPALLLLRFFWGMTLPAGFLLPAIYMAVFISACSMLWMISHSPAGWVPISILAWGPMSLAAIISWISTPILLHRPLIASSPFIYVIVAYALTPLLEATRRAQLFAAIFLIPAFLLSPVGYMLNSSRIRGGDEMARVEALLRSNWKSGDVLYIVGDGPLVNLMASMPDLPLYRFPECQPVTSYLSAQTRKALGVREQNIDGVLATRLWFIYGVVPFSPPCEREIIDQVTHGEALSRGTNQFTYGGVYLVTK